MVRLLPALELTFTGAGVVVTSVLSIFDLMMVSVAALITGMSGALYLVDRATDRIGRVVAPTKEAYNDGYWCGYDKGWRERDAATQFPKLTLIRPARKTSP